TVTLPVVDAAAPEKTGLVEEPATPPDPVRILVVDDNQAAARMLELLLSKMGEHDIRVAYDGIDALASAREHRPQLILLDIGLPRLDGYGVVESLRTDPAF